MSPALAGGFFTADQQGNPLLSTSALLQENFVLKIADRYREMCTNPKYTAQ